MQIAFGQPIPGEVFIDCPDCPEMVVIPAGQFIMGASTGEEERENLSNDWRGVSQPLHSVEVRQFAAGKFSVTRAQYEVFVSDTRRRNPGCMFWNGSKFVNDWDAGPQSTGFPQTERHPVACVSWFDAIDYVKWLSQKTGKSYRLLSEAEWEYAARAGTTTSRYWGDDGNLSCSYANGADQKTKAYVPGASNWAAATCNDGYAYTSPVGSFKPNHFGLYDMLGNVRQWTQDCWNSNYSARTETAANDKNIVKHVSGAPTDGSAWIKGECHRRVLRGGSWVEGPKFLRAASRNHQATEERRSTIGFRVARDLP